MKKNGKILLVASLWLFSLFSTVAKADGQPVFVTNASDKPVFISYGTNDPFYIALTQTTPNLLQNAFQDMKNYLGLNILKYSEQQSRLDAINPPSASQSKSNGAYMALNQSFVNYWQQLFGSTILVRNLLQAPGGSADSSLVGRHLVNYCSNEEAKKGYCAPASTDNYGNYIGAADLTAASILTYTSFPNSAVNPAAGGAGAPAPFQLAAIDFVNNLVNPVPVSIPKDAFQGRLVGTTNIRGKSAAYLPTSSTGDGTLSAMYRSAAMMSVPQTILMNMIAERTQVPGLGVSLGITDPTKKDISTWEALQYEATRRFQSEQWHEDINNSPPAALLREIANIEAMQLAMQFKQLQQNEEIKMLLAAQASYVAQVQMQGAMAAQQNSQPPNVTSP